MTTTINVKTPAELKKAYKKIGLGIQKPLKNTRRMFIQLGVQVDRDTMLTFKKEGAYQDREPWKKFNMGRGVGFYDTKKGSTTRTKKGTWKIRYGTDLNPKYPKWKGIPRTKGGQIKKIPGMRRFGMKSKLLQAGGGFKSSFKIIRVSNKKMRYGSNYGGDLAENIMKYPKRPVVQYTKADEKKYTRNILSWWFKNTKI